ncbi:MAG: hypothetical protein ACM3IK_01315 [Sphingomonadaceae bacterium]
MRTSKLCFSEWLDIGVACVLQLMVVVGMFAVAIWLWPFSLSHFSLAEITLEHVIRFVVSVASFSAGITALYLLATQRSVWGSVEIRRRDDIC